LTAARYLFQSNRTTIGTNELSQKVLEAAQYSLMTGFYSKVVEKVTFEMIFDNQHEKPKVKKWKKNEKHLVRALSMSRSELGIKTKDIEGEVSRSNRDICSYLQKLKKKLQNLEEHLRQIIKTRDHGSEKHAGSSSDKEGSH
jgi:hypothetical protein